MSGPLVSASAAFVAKNSRIPPYEIEQSLRFDGSSYLEWTPSSSGNGDSWTVSLWYKFDYPASRPGGIQFFQSDGTNTVNVYTYAASAAPADGRIYMLLGGGGSPYNRTLSQMRDASAWYHLVVVYDGADGTAQERQRFYINGVQQPTESPGTAPDGRTSTWMQNVKHKISTDTTEKFYGYMAEFHAIDGQQLLPTDFGEYDDNGVWRPIEYTGTYGTNGFYMKFDPSATNGIGHDHSGNGNNFTPSGFTTSGTGSDVMSDTPTTNWCTWNSVHRHRISTYLGSFSNGNLKATTGGSTTHFFGTQAIPPASTNGYYFEITADSIDTARTYIGLVDVSGAFSGTANSGPWEFDNVAVIRSNSDYLDGGGTDSGAGTSYTNGDTIMVAYKEGSVWFGKNGTWMASGDPAAGTNAIATDLDTSVFWTPYASYNSTFTANFGAAEFAYTPPTGFKALNTSNLPAPTVKDGSKYFNTVIYTGASPSDKAVTGVGFQPDFTWIKARTQAYSHALYDAVRGATKELHSDTADQEDTDTNGLKSFDSDGFTVGSDGEVGDPTGTRVSWNWLADNGTSSNTDGTITSTVSANATAGFSIISFTGTGSAASIGHGLGVKPGLVIGKDRDRSVEWKVYFPILGNYVELSTTAAQSSVSNAFTGATSSVLNLQGSGYGLNYSGDKSIVYCFAEVEGYSKFGSYTGNGADDGTFVYCGFKPAWLLMKNTGSSHWLLLDVARGQYYNPIGYKNSTKESLYANSNAAESGTGTGFKVDFLSNGFKCRASVAGELNVSGDTYVYAAFAEKPFGGSGVSPATAR